MSVGQRIKQVRTGRKLTMEAFGKQIGVTRNSISMIEAGKNNPSDQTIRSICREFNVSETWLRTGTGAVSEIVPDDELTNILQEYGLPMYMRDLFLRYGSLPIAAQEAFRVFVRGLVAEIMDEQAKDVSGTNATIGLPVSEMPEEAPEDERLSEEEIEERVEAYRQLLKGEQRLKRQLETEMKLSGIAVDAFGSSGSSGGSGINGKVG